MIFTDFEGEKSKKKRRLDYLYHLELDYVFLQKNLVDFFEQLYFSFKE